MKMQRLTCLDFRAHLQLLRYGAGKAYLYKKTYLEVSPGARISVAPGAEFHYNCSWTRRNPFPALLAVSDRGRVTVRDNFKIFAGAKIYVYKDAELILGSGYINEDLRLACYDRIEIGEGVAIAENVTIRDSDNHALTSNPEHRFSSPVRIGNHVWIGMNATVLKGVTIGDGAIVAAGALVNKDVPPRTLVGGVPARVLRTDVEWE